MDQRTKQGVEINKMANENVLYLDKDNLDRLDVSAHVKKKRMCRMQHPVVTAKIIYAISESSDKY